MKIFTHSDDSLMSTALLVLRIGLGVIMFAHGAQKVLGIWGGKGLEPTAAGISGMLGVPLWVGYVPAFAEFFGGIFLVLGLFTRLFGIVLLIDMLVAVFAVHLKNGFFMPTGFEFPGMLGIAALAISIAGPGMFSLDWPLFHRTVTRTTVTSTRRQPPFTVPSGGTAQFGR